MVAEILGLDGVDMVFCSLSIELIVWTLACRRSGGELDWTDSRKFKMRREWLLCIKTRSGDAAVMYSYASCEELRVKRVAGGEGEA